MSQINDQIKKIKTMAKQKLENLSGRERLLAVAAAIVLGVILFNKIYAPISLAFKTQAEELAKQEIYLTELPNILSRYKSLENKRKQIEEAYQGIEIEEGLSHIESIIKEKAELVNSQDYQIRERPLSQKNFGGDYEQKSFAVELKIRSLKALSSLLKELTTGKKPMILSSLDLNKSPSGEMISVSMELSTIQKKAAGGEVEGDGASEPASEVTQ